MLQSPAYIDLNYAKDTWNLRSWIFICLILWRKASFEAEKNQIIFVTEQEVKETKLGGSYLELSKLDNVFKVKE